MHSPYIQDGLNKVVAPIDKVQHITSFVSEETLKYVLTCLVLGFLFFSFLVIGIILIRRTIAIRNDKKAKVLKSKYETLLSESMSYYYENGKIFERKKFSEFLNPQDKTNRFNRKVLIEQIFLMKRHVGGEEAEFLNNLYKKLEYDKESFKKLKNRHWNTRLKGLQELILMDVKGIDKVFHRMILDRHQLVRIAAIKALILRGGDWLPTLVKYAYPMSAWEQFQICEAFSRRQSISLPDFKPLLKSLNPSVVEFSLKMIKHFHCLEAIESVIPFTKDENPKLANAAKEVLLQFGLEDMIAEPLPTETPKLLLPIAIEEILIVPEKSYSFYDAFTQTLPNFDLVYSLNVLKPLVNTTPSVYKQNTTNIPQFDTSSSSNNKTNCFVNESIQEDNTGILLKNINGIGDWQYPDISLRTEVKRVKRDKISDISERPYQSDINTFSSQEIPTVMNSVTSYLSLNNGWSIPITGTRIITNKDACSVALMQVQALMKQNIFKNTPLIKHYIEKSIGKSQFISPLYDIPNLVNIMPLRRGSKLFIEENNPNEPQNRNQLFKNPVFLNEKTQNKNFTRLGKTNTVEQKSIHDMPFDEQMKWRGLTKKGVEIEIEITRWNNVLKKDKQEFAMQDKLMDIVAIRILDAHTQEFLNQTPQYFAICGQLKTDVTLEQILAEYNPYPDTILTNIDLNKTEMENTEEPHATVQKPLTKNQKQRLKRKLTIASKSNKKQQKTYLKQNEIP